MDDDISSRGSQSPRRARTKRRFPEDGLEFAAMLMYFAVLWFLIGLDFIACAFCTGSNHTLMVILLVLSIVVLCFGSILFLAANSAYSKRPQVTAARDTRIRPLGSPRRPLASTSGSRHSRTSSLEPRSLRRSSSTLGRAETQLGETSFTNILETHSSSDEEIQHSPPKTRSRTASERNH